MLSHRTHVFKLPNRIRFFNKYVTNRLLRVFAKLSLGPFALIRHVGRRSGKPYETVIWAWRLGEGFVIALTYGPEVDWYRNMRAAGGGTLVWHKRVWRSSWECPSGSYHQGRPVFGCADGSHFASAHSLGSSYCNLSITGRITGTT